MEDIRQHEAEEQKLEREEEFVDVKASNDVVPLLTDSETEEEDSDDDTLPPLTDSEDEEEEEDDYDSDDDSLPDLVSADEEDYEDEGIADCDTFISMDSLIVLLGRYGLNNQQD